MRFKGNGTYNAVPKFGKPSFKIDLNKYVKGQKLAGVSTLNLHSNITDASWMNEVLAYRLYRDAGAPAPRTAYARVYVTIPGSQARKYLGLYSLVENVDTNFFADARYGVPGGRSSSRSRGRRSRISARTGRLTTRPTIPKRT